MITVLVQFKLPDDIAIEHMPMAIAGIASGFHNAFGLIDKSFLTSRENRSFAAVLLWSSRDDAEWFFTATWKAMMLEDYEFELYLTYFDNSFVMAKQHDPIDVMDFLDIDD
ncbi:MAG: hypothetical protein AAF215_14490 [Cyanobacteria bacterium P01_A01_bin.123]